MFHNQSMIVWQNGEFFPTNAAYHDALSTGHLVGWGAFTTLRIAHSQAVWLPRHLERLRQHSAQLNLVSPFSNHQWQTALEHLINENRLVDGFARATISGPRDARWPIANAPDSHSLLSLAITSAPANSVTPSRVWLSDFHQDARRPLCGIKCTSYAPWHWLWQRAQNFGCDEVLWKDSSGALCEAARSNLFWKRGAQIFTPSLQTGCLAGIARAWTLQVARKHGWKCYETHATAAALRHADEIWLCNAVTGPRAIAEIVHEIVHQAAASTCTSDFASPSTAAGTCETFWRYRTPFDGQDFVAQLQSWWQDDIARNEDW